VTEAPKASVPNVAGKAQSSAKSELEKLGFTVEVQYEKNDSVAEGNVIRQSPAAGTQLTVGSKVTLTVSSGRPTTAVANVVGKTQAEAKSTLEAQGFKVTFTEEYSATVAAGKVIRQSPAAGSGQYSGTTITVVISKGPILPNGVTLDKSSASLNIGATVQLKATVTPSDAHDKSVTWSSSNTSVATVSSSGLVTAKAPGTATITVKTNSNGKTATCTVTVKTPTIGSISNQSMFIGDTKSVAFTTANPEAVLPLSDVKATSSNTGVVEVTGFSYSFGNYVNLKAKAAGSATITIAYTVGSTTVKTTFTVTVNTPKVTLSSYSGSVTFDCGTYGVHTTNNKPSWPASLPTASSNTGNSISWEVISGDAFLSGKTVYVTNPAEKVVVRAYFYYNGVKYYADYTNTLVLKKTTSGANNLRKGHGTNYGTYISIPAGKTVTITEVWYDYSTRNSEGLYYAWGKVTYGGYTGWVVVY
jgi:beta-lactam-binding protein with PASTA domain